MKESISSYDARSTTPSSSMIVFLRLRQAMRAFIYLQTFSIGSIPVENGGRPLGNGSNPGWTLTFCRNPDLP